jgi:hypothetical protein
MRGDRTLRSITVSLPPMIAGLDDYARALHGIRANSSAVSMVAATTALEALISAVSQTGPIDLSAITSDHEALMRDEPREALTRESYERYRIGSAEATTRHEARSTCRRRTKPSPTT